jgi:hypothetical protein
MRTVLLVGAIVSTISNTRSIALLFPMMFRELVGRVHRPLQQDVLLLQPLAIELLADPEPQHFGVERLLDVVVRRAARRRESNRGIRRRVIMIAMIDG